MTDTNGQGQKLGIAGRIARAFLTTEITPLLALTGLLLGLFAVLVTPREEEPQINVTFANVFIPYPGATAQEVESRVTYPAEQIVAEIDGVKNIYSVSSPGMAALTVRFRVGEDRTAAIVRLYNAFFSNQNWQPANSGIGMPLIQPKGIDDVPIVALTLWSEDPDHTAMDLTRVARSLRSQLQQVEGTRDIEIIGATDTLVHVEFDPARLAGYDISLDELRMALQATNVSADAGTRVDDNSVNLVQAGTFLATPEEVADLVVGVRSGAPVFLRDVASVSLGADQPQTYVSFAQGPATGASASIAPAVTLSIAKKPGENAVEVADAVVARFDAMRGIHLPDSMEATVTRNYGATASDKAQTLIKKLLFATLSVVVLVWISLGRREAIVVGAAVVVTLAATLFASWAWGFTLNRVSLFALIFSIGILVDDAIVVVENIHRHMVMGGRKLVEAVPLAVDEVGGPTILATFTVIAALLPMAFVTGLMGPYMRPIPINASTGMLISLAVAFVFTPWLYMRFFAKGAAAHGHHEDAADSRTSRLFRRLMLPFLRQSEGNGWRWGLLGGLLILIAGSVMLAVSQVVILKMLPFDNKSEFQVLVDMPEGTTLEQTQAALQALAQQLDQVPEVTDYQLYAGTSAPINFNGLVRQYYLRSGPHQGDIQVNLLDKHYRDRKSHDIALEVRELLAEQAQQYGANVKIVEVPPGPPVMAPLVAELYGIDYSGLQELAGEVTEAFRSTPEVVDVDNSLEASQIKEVATIDQSRAATLGVAQQSITSAISAALQGEDMSYLHDPYALSPVPIRVELPASEQGDTSVINSIRVRAQNGALVPISELAQWQVLNREQSIHHKDLKPVVYVMGDVAGETDSPLYGLAGISGALDEDITQTFISAPDYAVDWTLKWDGEWQVTYETFRDMGAAYGVGLILIYLLVVAQFRSYGVPLIIMAPIPLTIIGILPGHALLGQQFTAPSMIGMIALAGIIVRNSILLVDFIQQEVTSGKDLQTATIDAAIVRARPIVLTALAAMMGGFFILDDPIFGGLAVSLIFGLLVSTLLTLIVIPVVYYHYNWRKAQQA